MKKNNIIAVMALTIGAATIGAIALSYQTLGVSEARAETSRAVEAVAGEETTLETVSFDVPGMTCGSCPYMVRKTLQGIDGVTEAESFFQTRSATATYDPSETSIDVMLEALKNLGYPSSVVE